MKAPRSSPSRTPVHILIAVLISLATAFGLASEASATPGSPIQIPIFQLPEAQIGIDRRQPPRSCGPLNDGQEVVWDGWLWRCGVVAGDIPPWQWEPIRKV